MTSYIQRRSLPGARCADGTMEFSLPSCDNIGLFSEPAMTDVEVYRALERGETVGNDRYTYHLVKVEPKPILPSVVFEMSDEGNYRVVVFESDADGDRWVADIFEAKTKKVLLSMLVASLEDRLP